MIDAFGVSKGVPKGLIALAQKQTGRTYARERLAAHEAGVALKRPWSGYSAAVDRTGPWPGGSGPGATVVRDDAIVARGNIHERSAKMRRGRARNMIVMKPRKPNLP